MTSSKLIKIVAISDVHGKWKDIVIPEDTDILISAGDYSFRGEKHMIRDFHKWLNKQPAKHIISCQGNHELFIEKNFKEAKEIAEKACPRVIFTELGVYEVEGLKIFCAAHTPRFFNWAYNRDRGEDIKKIWDQIPDLTDIVVTHGPPMGFLDIVDGPFGGEQQVGCADLRDAIFRIKPQAHIFGHIHQQHGVIHFANTSYVNASICDDRYKAAYSPITFFVNAPKVLEEPADK